jgi:Zn-dependent alcohol dehydrogenase
MRCARLAGASRIVVIDIQPKRLEAARGFGATDVIDSTKSKPVDAVRDLLPGGVDHVFDFVGLKVVAEEGLAMLAVGGELYLVGVAKPEVDISLNIFAAIGGQRRVVGVNFGSTNAKHDIPMYAQLYLQGRLNLDDLVSKPLNRTPRGNRSSKGKANLPLQIFRPVWEARLRFDARVVNRSKNTAYLECDITDHDGKRVAKAAST